MGLFGKIFGGHTAEPKVVEISPAEKLQAILNQQVANLNLGRQALERSAGLVRTLNAEKTDLQEDINTLTARTDDVSKQKLAHKQEQLVAKQKEIDAAVLEHQQNSDKMEEFSDDIKSTRGEADRLNVTLDLAKADESAAQFKSGLKGFGVSNISDVKEQLAAQVNKVKASADLNRSLAGDDDDKWLKAAEGK